MKLTVVISLLTGVLVPFSASFAAESCNGPNQELRSNGHGGTYCHTNIDIDEIFQNANAPTNGSKPAVKPEKSAQKSAAGQQNQAKVDKDKAVCPNCTFHFKHVDNGLDHDAMMQKLDSLQNAP